LRKPLPRKTDRRQNQETSWTAIGKALGLSDETVRQAYLSGIEKLRAWAELGELSCEGEAPRFSPPPRGRLKGDAEFPQGYDRLVIAHKPAAYRDWSRDTTVVVSGPIADAGFRGRWFPDRDSARAYWRARAGHIYEDINIPGRYVFRVKRGTSATTGTALQRGADRVREAVVRGAQRERACEGLSCEG
jgi:hypothetical protein